VNFGNCSGVSQSIVYNSNTQVNVAYSIAPSASPGVCSVTVSTPSGTSNTVSFTISVGPPPPPIITGLSISGDNAGNNGGLSIYGQNLTPNPSVSFNNCSGITSSVSYSSSGLIGVNYSIAASAVAATCSVSVTTASGTSNSVSFTISTAPLPAPVILGISPSSDSAGGSGYIAIYGQNLTNGSVSISGDAVTISPVYVAAGQINVWYSIAASASPGVRTITVTTTSGTSNGAAFTVQ
jgi:hypothetical protein